ncbi:hypothetical protein FJT64_026021 [Amphibalanus amphitrite]|uniref:C-type lectin domain-containing protein n=1 Tax=Amphibalanus amphitrite TaxID=1232801 RepID=A0A6A4W364_AMPAM|nr:hypothetical protein FJT64_026021 [Amphibalanus amphitrite]
MVSLPAAPLLLLLLVPAVTGDRARSVALFPSPPSTVTVQEVPSPIPGRTRSLVECAALCAHSAGCGGVVPTPDPTTCRLVTPAGTLGTTGYFWIGSGTWMEGVRQCPTVTAGAALVAVHSAEESSAVQSLLLAAGESEAHLALYRPAPGQDWVWAEGDPPEVHNSPAPYILWHSGEPNELSHPGGLCAVIKSADGEWYDRKISQGQVRPLLCMYPLQ